MQEIIIKKTKPVDSELLVEAMTEKKKVKIILEGYTTQVDMEKYAELSDKQIREQYRREAETETSKEPAKGTRANQNQVTSRSLLKNNPGNLLVN